MPAVRIQSKVEGFRRCGRAHSIAPTEYMDGYWTPGQLARLRAEPMLIVETYDEPNLRAPLSQQLVQPRRRAR